MKDFDLMSNEELLENFKTIVGICGYEPSPENAKSINEMYSAILSRMQGGGFNTTTLSNSSTPFQKIY